jgi:hypothetical protein
LVCRFTAQPLFTEQVSVLIITVVYIALLYQPVFSVIGVSDDSPGRGLSCPVPVLVVGITFPSHHLIRRYHVTPGRSHSVQYIP